MSTTTKSPKKLAAAAYHILRSTLPEHSSRYSPKKFTQPQLMVCLVLKTFFNTDYRGIVQILDDCPNLCKVFELKTVPHFTTLQKATRRLMKYNITKDLLVATIRKVMGKRKIVPLAAVDATGFENGHISPYFFKHSSRSRKQHKSSKFTKWPKMAVLADTDNHLILAIAEDRGPGRDATHFEKLLLRIPKSITVKALVADAGYDSEKSHELARETYGINSIISPKSGRKSITNKLPKGKYRRQMKTRFDKKRYGQRWQVETVYSMIKRNLTDCLNSKSYWAQYREMLLLAITHNLLIVLLVG
jgi:hypothetical protein